MPFYDNPSNLDISQTYNIDESTSFEIPEDEMWLITINEVLYLVGKNDGKFTWDIDGSGEYLFSDIDEEITRGAEGVYFKVIYKGEGSFLFEIEFLSDDGFSITNNNFIVVYNLDNLDSVEFAAYYANARELDFENGTDPSAENEGSIGGIRWQVNGQLLGIQCSSNELLSTESDFNTYVLNPIKNAIDNSTELLSRVIGGIVLGYKVPGGFYDGADVISSTSRLSRIYQTFSKKIKNKLYDRQVFKRFDSVDASFALICSRIDGPNLQFVKKTIDRGTILRKQLFANGKFYIDPYSDRHATGADDYQSLLVDFKDNMLPTLNLLTWETTFMDPYIDSTIPFVEDDSFVWSWFTDRASSSFFQNSNAIRVFFYNADYDGALTVRDENGKTWPFLALDAGYVLTAGSMSNPTIDGFLNPNAFYYSLLRGATLGEAFLFSIPYLDWTVSLFGDPLLLCSFDSEEIADEDVIGKHVVWEMMSKDLAKAAATLYKKETEINEILHQILDITSGDFSSPSVEQIFDPTEAESLLLPFANDLYNQNKEIIWKGQLKPLVNRLFDFPSFKYFDGSSQTQAPTINDYLIDNSFKVSRILASISQEAEPIEDGNLYDEGWWQFEFVLNDDSISFVNYHFILEVSDDEFFDNIILTKDSVHLTNWKFEKEKEVFSDMTFNGVSSSFIGRKVRYESRFDDSLSIDEYLTRGETYYFRITQYNLITSEQYASRSYSDIIWT